MGSAAAAAAAPGPVRGLCVLHGEALLQRSWARLGAVACMCAVHTALPARNPTQCFFMLAGHSCVVGAHEALKTTF